MVARRRSRKDRLMFRVGSKYQHLVPQSACSCCSPAVQEAVRRIDAHLTRRAFLGGTAAAAALGFGLSGEAMAQTPAAPPTLFTNVNVFNGRSPNLARGMNVLIEGDKIKDVRAGAMAPPPGATVINGGGRTLMPGLIDVHVHIFLSASTERQMLDPTASFDDMTARALEESKQMLLRGFTAVRDVGGPIFHLKRAIDKGDAMGPRVWPSGGMVSQTSGHGDFRTPDEKSRRFGAPPSVGEKLGAGFIADGRDEVLTAVRENLRFGASQIKMMAGGGAASTYDPLDVAQYTLDELKAGVEAAADWNTYVCVHAYTVRAVRRAIEAGVKCIEHGQLLDEPTVKLLADRGIWLSLQSLDPAPPTATDNVRQKKAQVIEGTDNAFTWAKKHGVKLAFGSDILLQPAATKNQITDMVKLKKWYTPAQALKILTYENAQLLALSGPRNPYPGKLGVVEANAYADLLLVDGDPTANLDLIGDPAKNFKIIMKGGKVHKNTL
jgi:imidazolonepropionase-like amidohydrolase